MEALAGLAIATLILTSLAVAIRLLALYRRSGEAPELLLGLMLLLSVGLGYPLRIATTRVDAATVGPLVALSSLAIALAYSCLIAFTLRVFRRDSRPALAVAAAGIVSLLGTAVWEARRTLFGAEVGAAFEVNAASLLHGFVVIAAYVWTAWESLRYFAIMKRRQRLGMADPVVCNRLLLWGLMGIIVGVGVLINVVAGISGVSIVESPGVLLASSTTGLAQAVLLVLAFAPPRSYLAWVRGPAAVRAA